MVSWSFLVLTLTFSFMSPGNVLVIPLCFTSRLWIKHSSRTVPLVLLKKKYVSVLSRLFSLSLLLGSSFLSVSFPVYICFRNFHHLQIFQELFTKHTIKFFTESPHHVYLSHFLCLEKPLFSQLYLFSFKHMYCNAIVIAWPQNSTALEILPLSLQSRQYMNNKELT